MYLRQNRLSFVLQKYCMEEEYKQKIVDEDLQCVRVSASNYRTKNAD